MSRYPFFCVIIIDASIKTQAENYMQRQGLGADNFTVPIILKTDPDTADPRGWGCITRADFGMLATFKKRAAAAGPLAKLFYDTKRKDVKQRVLQKIDAWGYRIKPTEEPS